MRYIFTVTAGRRTRSPPPQPTKGYHCAYQIHYHIVFPVNYRKVLLPEPIVQAIKEIAHAIQERYGIKMERIGCDQNHIHLLLCSAHPRYAPGQLICVFKSVTAKQLFLRFPNLRKDLWGGEFWTDGYYVATVSERGNWKVVEQSTSRPRAQNQRTSSSGSSDTLRSLPQGYSLCAWN